MAVLAKCLVEAKQVENVQTTQYTAANNITTIIDKFTMTNVTGGGVTVTVNIVRSGLVADTYNIIVSAKSIGAGETYIFPEIVGQILNPGDYISTIAGTASALNMRVSGREIS